MTKTKINKLLGISSENKNKFSNEEIIEKIIDILFTHSPLHLFHVLNSFLWVPELQANPKWKGKNYPILFNKLKAELKSNISNTQKLLIFDRFFYGFLLKALKDCNLESFGRRFGNYETKDILNSVSELEIIRGQFCKFLFANKDKKLQKQREKLDFCAKKVATSIFLRVEKDLKEFIVGEAKKEIEESGVIVLSLIDYNFDKYEEIFGKTHGTENRVREKLKLLKEDLKNPNVGNDNFKQLGDEELLDKIESLEKRNDELTTELEKIVTVLRFNLTLELKKIRMSAANFTYCFREDIKVVDFFPDFRLV